MNDFEPGDDVVHDEYGPGTIKEHPDGRDGTWVFFHELDINTIMVLPRYDLEFDC